MAEHLPQQGHQFYYSADAGSTYVEITDMLDVTVPPLKREKSDDTVLSSTRKVSTPGYLEDDAEGKFSKYTHKTLDAILQGYFTAKTNPTYWKLKKPLLSGESVASFWTWQGHVTEYSEGDVKMSGTDKVKTSVTIVPTTRPLYTVAT